MPKLEQMPEEHVYQAYGIYLLGAQHRLIQQLRQRYGPSSHGDRTWQSSFILMDYLQQRPPRARSRIMEIGCGLGQRGGLLRQDLQGARHRRRLRPGRVSVS